MVDARQGYTSKEGCDQAGDSTELATLSTRKNGSGRNCRAFGIAVAGLLAGRQLVAGGRLPLRLRSRTAYFAWMQACAPLCGSQPFMLGLLSHLEGSIYSGLADIFRPLEPASVVFLGRVFCRPFEQHKSNMRMLSPAFFGTIVAS